MGLTKTKRAEEKAKRKGVDIHAYEEYRNFIDRLEANDTDTYLNLWMQVGDKTNPKTIDANYQQWRTLVQGAFIEGYQAGFTDRLFKGETK